MCVSVFVWSGLCVLRIIVCLVRVSVSCPGLGPVAAAGGGPDGPEGIASATDAAGGVADATGGAADATSAAADATARPAFRGHVWHDAWPAGSANAEWHDHAARPAV